MEIIGHEYFNDFGGYCILNFISDEMIEFFQLPQFSIICSRVYLTKQLAMYIRNNKLLDSTNYRTIHPDDKLERLLKTNGEELTYFNLQRFISPHLKINYRLLRERMQPLAEELMANRFHPKNFDKFCQWGFDDFQLE